MFGLAKKKIETQSAGEQVPWGTEIPLHPSAAASGQKLELKNAEEGGFEPPIPLQVFPEKNTVFPQRDSQWGRNPTQIQISWIAKALSQFGDAQLIMAWHNFEPAIRISLTKFLIQLLYGEWQPKILAVGDDDPKA